MYTNKNKKKTEKVNKSETKAHCNEWVLEFAIKLPYKTDYVIKSLSKAKKLKWLPASLISIKWVVCVLFMDAIAIAINHIFIEINFAFLIVIPVILCRFAMRISCLIRFDVRIRIIRISPFRICFVQHLT